MNMLEGVYVIWNKNTPFQHMGEGTYFTVTDEGLLRIYSRLAKPELLVAATPGNWISAWYEPAKEEFVKGSQDGPTP